MPVRASLLADGPGDLGPMSELLEGVPWPVRAIVVLMVMTSPWWGPKLSDRAKRRRRSRSRPPNRPTGRDTEPDPDDEDDPEDEELRRLRDTLIGVVQDLQAKSQEAADLARDLQRKGTQLERERERAEQLERDVARLTEEVAQMRDLLNTVIDRRERTPPHGHPRPPI